MPSVPEVKQSILRIAEAFQQRAPVSGQGAASFARALDTALSSGKSTARSIPLPPPGKPAHTAQEAMLNIFAHRQQLIAGNIANADTPNYKAVDIDMREALVNAMTPRAPRLELTATRAGHRSPPVQQTPPLPVAQYPTPAQASLDGNTVEMDTERSKLAENSLMYEFSQDRVGGRFKKMLEMFQQMKN
jgi:flagellar basal-body rod protein FlgB